MTKIKCPSEAWDQHVEDEERTGFPHDEERLKLLNAYGHLRWTVGFGDDEEEAADRGDWLACFDFQVDIDPSGKVSVAYHVVVNSDSGGFIETTEESVVSADKAPFGLPTYWAGIGMNSGVEWTEQEREQANECQERWETALRAAIDTAQADIGETS